MWYGIVILVLVIAGIVYIASVNGAAAGPAWRRRSRRSTGDGGVVYVADGSSHTSNTDGSQHVGRSDTDGIGDSSSSSSVDGGSSSGSSDGGSSGGGDGGGGGGGGD